MKLFLDDVTEIVGDLDRILSVAQRSRRRAVALPHYYPNGVKVYKIRALDQLPLQIDSFVGPSPDPSKVMGLVNYHGLIAENVYTRGIFPSSSDFDESSDASIGWAAWLSLLEGDLEKGASLSKKVLKSELSGVLKSAAHCVLGNFFESRFEMNSAFSHYAIASVTYPLPESFLGMASTDMDDSMAHIKRGWKEANEAMDVLPWSHRMRFVIPALKACCASISVDEAIKFAKRGLIYDPDNTDLKFHRDRFLIEIQELKKSGARISDDLRFTGLDRFHRETGRLLVTSDLKQSGAVFIPLQSPELGWIPDFIHGHAVVATSRFQYDEIRKTFPFFLQDDYFSVCPLGFDPSKLSRDKVSDLAVSETNHVSSAIVYRVRKKIPDLTIGDVVGSRIYLECPLHEPQSKLDTGVIEAQSRGTIPIVPAVGCLQEFTRGGFCYKPYPRRSFIEAASERICQLLRDEGHRNSVIEAGLRVNEEFSWASLEPRWLDLIT